MNQSALLAQFYKRILHQLSTDVPLEEVQKTAERFLYIVELMQKVADITSSTSQESWPGGKPNPRTHPEMDV